MRKVEGANTLPNYFIFADKIIERADAMNKTKFVAILLLLSVNYTAAIAESNSGTLRIEEERVNEVWVNPGFYSHHFQEDRDLNNTNHGFGIEYRYSTVFAAIAGRYNNSVRQQTNYFALLMQPIAVGGIRIGGALGIINGYPEVNNGNWFPMIIPVASYEYKNVGINVTYIPTIQDTIYGALAFQLRFKIY